MTNDELREAYLSTRIWFVTDVIPYYFESVPEDSPGAMDTDFPGALDVTLAQAFGLGVSEVWCITADNPESEVLSEAENIARNQELTDLLQERKLPIMFGVGKSPDGSYSEVTTLVGLQPDADIESNREVIITLARKFEQNAVFRFVDYTQELVPVLDDHFVGTVKYRMRNPMHSL